MIFRAFPTFLERRRIRQDWQGLAPLAGLGQSLETTGGVIAAEMADQADKGQPLPPFWRSVAVGVTTAAFVWMVTRSLDHAFGIRK